MAGVGGGGLEQRGDDAASRVVAAATDPSPAFGVAMVGMVAMVATPPPDAEEVAQRALDDEEARRHP